MQYEIIGWTGYDDPDYEMIEDTTKQAYLSTTVIKEIRKCGYRFPGDRHADMCGGYVPVFNSGEKFCTSQRQWGAIMAQAWHEDNRNSMGYNKWHLTWGGRTEGFVYPELGVDKSRIVRGVELEYEPPLDEEYYVAGPRNHGDYMAMIQETIEFIQENNVRTVDLPENKKDQG